MSHLPITSVERHIEIEIMLNRPPINPNQSLLNVRLLEIQLINITYIIVTITMQYPVDRWIQIVSSYTGTTRMISTLSSHF